MKILCGFAQNVLNFIVSAALLTLALGILCMTLLGNAREKKDEL